MNDSKKESGYDKDINHEIREGGAECEKRVNIEEKRFQAIYTSLERVVPRLPFHGEDVATIAREKMPDWSESEISRFVHRLCEVDEGQAWRLTKEDIVLEDLCKLSIQLLSMRKFSAWTTTYNFELCLIKGNDKCVLS